MKDEAKDNNMIARKLTNRLNQHSLFAITLIFIFAIAIFTRVYRAGTYPFGFDQIQIVENSRNILSGDLTLIGPRTGYADMFTGPLIYYAHSLLAAFSDSLYTLVALSVSFAGITGLSLFLLSYRYCGRNCSLITVALWAISPYIIQLDRITWNPNLTLLAASLSFFPLLSKKIGAKELLLFSLGSFLGFQAHFSGLLLPILIVIFSFIFHKWQTAAKISVFIIFGFSVSIAPLILFDLRNQWLNIHGLSTFLNSNSQFSIIQTAYSIFKSLTITTENLGKMLSLYTNNTLTHAVGTLIYVFAAIHCWKSRDRLLLITLLWITAIGIILGFYSGPKPEYYYLIQMPAILTIYGLLLSQLEVKHSKVLIGLFTTYALCLNISTYQPSTRLELGNVLRVNSYIHQLSKEKNLQKIVYDMDLGEENGLQFLLDDIAFDATGVVVHIAYPQKVEYESAVQFGDISVWQDPRLDNNHITEADFIITHLPNYRLYKQFRSVLPFGPESSYLLTQNEAILGYISVLTDKNAPAVYDSLVQECENKEGCYRTWTPSSIDGQPAFTFIKRRMIFYFVPTPNLAKDHIITTITTMQIY